MSSFLPGPSSTPPPSSGPGSDPAFFLPKVEVTRVGGFLKRWGWLPVVFGVLGGALAFWISGKVTKYYISHGSVYVSTEAPRISEIQAATTEESRDLEQMQSVEQGMLSNMLLMQVSDRLALAKDPSFAPKATTDAQRLEVLSHRLQVALRRGTRLIDITVEDPDPVRAQQIVTAVKEEYESLSTERQEAILQEMIEGLHAEESRLQMKMEASEGAVTAFREAHPVPGLDGEAGAASAGDEWSILAARLSEAKAERMRLEAERDAFARLDPEDPNALAGLPASGSTEEVGALVREVREKELEFARVKERYLYKHPEFKRAEAELIDTRNNLKTAMATAAEAIGNRYRIATENENKLSREVASARSQTVDVEGLRAEFSRLKQQASNDRELYDQVSRQLREAHLAGSVPASVLSWRDQPTVPEKPSRPRKALMLGVGSVLAFGFGLVIAVGLELGDTRVRGAAGVMRATGVPMLGELPVGDERSGAVVLSDPQSSLADAFRRLRVVLAPRSQDDRLHTILFATAKPGEGASFCAVNHAVSLAVEGHRTLLIDADLRTPGLSRDFLKERAGHLGLGGYLDGKATAADACVRTSVPALYLISSGEMRADAPELLSRTRFAALIEEAGNWFDRIVIDAPAVLGSPDAQILSRCADRTCLVVGREGGDRRELREAARHLRSSGGNLVGFVWNERVVARGDAPSLTVLREGLGHGSASDMIISPQSRTST
ncbi:capsular exopolysaccharide synthesis family protein [Haloferula luteola]|uniref:Capsular exopolysaccharide synthesis family protein n=1 Tax=Haloferula luteola TaxID=595692 RepID=A0A840V0I9_9BACT|nr:polysaccharide biosynthesis tyrosine autokinase [Haloferula luteola]MBB5351505.1 capsular exopolysaccharide synthesis family protein [Haloferula luteola]